MEGSEVVPGLESERPLESARQRADPAEDAAIFKRKWRVKYLKDKKKETFEMYEKLSQVAEKWV